MEIFTLIPLAEKPLFFAPLHKLLSLEKESKLSLYSLTAVFFCGRKRKRYKKRTKHVVVVSYKTKRDNSEFFCMYQRVFRKKCVSLQFGTF